MKAKIKNKRPAGSQKGKKKIKESEGYPLYPDTEDIYTRYQEETEINPEDPSREKPLVKPFKKGTTNEKDFSDDESGGDLDIPGSELDDNEEIIGSEDEENNYYSLGGDDHNDLDEDDKE